MRDLPPTIAIIALLAGTACGGGGAFGAGDEGIPEPPDVDVPDPAAGDDAEPNVTILFEKDVLPILQASCTSCHGQAAGLNLESHEALMKGSEKGPVIVPGDPGSSRFVHFLEGSEKPQMPLDVDPLTDDRITTIRTWILHGAAAD